jgi:hypothetical protein
MTSVQATSQVDLPRSKSGELMKRFLQETDQRGTTVDMGKKRCETGDAGTASGCMLLDLVNLCYSFYVDVQSMFFAMSVPLGFPENFHLLLRIPTEMLTGEFNRPFEKPYQHIPRFLASTLSNYGVINTQPLPHRSIGALCHFFLLET